MMDAQCRSIIHALRQGKRRQPGLLALETLRDGPMAEESVQIPPHNGDWCSKEIMAPSLSSELSFATEASSCLAPPYPRASMWPPAGTAGDGGTPGLCNNNKYAVVREVWVHLIWYFFSISLKPHDSGFLKTRVSS